jgi:hypothetical protein
VLETAPNEEMAEHLGYAKHDPAGTGLGNIRLTGGLLLFTLATALLCSRFKLFGPD